MDDFKGKRYRHSEMPGVAWYIHSIEYEHREDECEGHPADWDTPLGRTVYCDGSCEEPVSSGMVYAVMVGDNVKHLVDPDDLIEISDDDYCSNCGQIGCGH
jgi:hypothetical protein